MKLPRFVTRDLLWLMVVTGLVSSLWSQRLKTAEVEFKNTQLTASLQGEVIKRYEITRNDPDFYERGPSFKISSHECRLELWKLLPQNLRLRTVQFLAEQRHPEDDMDQRAERVAHYLRVAQIAEDEGRPDSYQLREVCEEVDMMLKGRASQ